MTSDKLSNHVVSDLKMMLGKPVIRGTRLTVELLMRKLAEGVAIEAADIGASLQHEAAKADE